MGNPQHPDSGGLHKYAKVYAYTHGSVGDWRREKESVTQRDESRETTMGCSTTAGNNIDSEYKAQDTERTIKTQEHNI